MISTNRLTHLNWQAIASGAAARRGSTGGSAFTQLLRAAAVKPAATATAGALVKTAADASLIAASSSASAAATTAAATPQTAAATPQSAALVSTTPAASDTAPQSGIAAAGSQDSSLPVAFSQPAVEAHMNAWWMSFCTQQNAQTQCYYDNALDGWKNTVQRNRELGIPEPPPPPPPKLVEVAPQAPGFWFQTA